MQDPEVLRRVKEAVKFDNNPVLLSKIWVGDINQKMGKTTLLFYSCYHGSYECTEWCLKHGADPDLPGKEGECPLHFTAGASYGRLMKLLLEYGARVDLKCHGRLPIECVTEWQHFGFEPALLLYEYGSTSHVKRHTEAWNIISNRISACRCSIAAFLLASKQADWHKDIIRLIAKLAWTLRRLDFYKK